LVGDEEDEARLEEEREGDYYSPCRQPRVKSAPSTPSKKEGQAPKLKRSSIKIYRVHHRSPLIVKGLILGFCSIVTLGLATIGYLFYRISKRK